MCHQYFSISKELIDLFRFRFPWESSLFVSFPNRLFLSGFCCFSSLFWSPTWNDNIISIEWDDECKHRWIKSSDTEKFYKRKVFFSNVMRNVFHDEGRVDDRHKVLLDGLTEASVRWFETILVFSFELDIQVSQSRWLDLGVFGTLSLYFV